MTTFDLIGRKYLVVIFPPFWNEGRIVHWKYLWTILMAGKNNLTKKYELVPSVDKGSHRDTKWIYKIALMINRFRINKMASWLTIHFPKTSNFTFSPNTHFSLFTIFFQKYLKIREFSSFKNNLMFMICSGEDINKMFLTPLTNSTHSWFITTFFLWQIKLIS